MKFDCGPTEEERALAKKRAREAEEAARKRWHRVFAWFPVQVGSHDCRWLEWVERRQRQGSFLLDHEYWEYRACAST